MLCIVCMYACEPDVCKTTATRPYCCNNRFVGFSNKTTWAGLKGEAGDSWEGEREEGSE